MSEKRIKHRCMATGAMGAYASGGCRRQDTTCTTQSPLVCGTLLPPFPRTRSLSFASIGYGMVSLLPSWDPMPIGHTKPLFCLYVTLCLQDPMPLFVYVDEGRQAGGASAQLSCRIYQPVVCHGKPKLHPSSSSRAAGCIYAVYRLYIGPVGQSWPRGTG
jgi:hypothetical protein